VTVLERETILRALRRRLPGATLVTQLGNTSNALHATADSAKNFYMLGSMGSVIPFSLGIALAVEFPVVALEGDGGALMSLGALTAVARYGPRNLGIVILDNGSYESTGGQETTECDFAKVAGACGLSSVRNFSAKGSEDELGRWLTLADGPKLAVAQTVVSATRYQFVGIRPSAIAGRVASSIAEQSKTHRH